MSRRRKAKREIPENPPPCFLLRPIDLERIWDLSRATVRNLRKSDDFPPQVQLAPGSVGYRFEDIKKWIDKRAS